MGMERVHDSIAAASVVAALLAAAPVPALAQDTIPLAIGSRIRIQAEDTSRRWVVGELLASPDDSVRFRMANSSWEVTMPAASLARLEVSRERRRQTGRGAWIGLGVGAGLGLILGLATDEAGCSEYCLGPELGSGFSAAAGMVFGGLVGLAGGALIGSSIQTDRWEPVRPVAVPSAVEAAGASARDSTAPRR